ncbi:MAG TPA: dienelactone hydrolase family protein [Candidatus Limnocylindria bacterium]|jgi:carboxymethylenebutenolidase|nr:dienelactone hydrolase family protein [Candidatus Limnocylindria bacterium]
MLSQSFTIDVGGSPMQAYLARPDDAAPRPAVIVLQEIFGVNAEVKRITDLVASAGYVGLAINYYHRTNPDLNEPYTQEGLEAGFKAAAQVGRASLRADVAAAIDWLNGQSFVQHGKIATWGFCFGGAVAFVTSTLPGLSAAICFYGGSIAAPLFNGEAPGLTDAPDVRVPLLLAYGGKDSYIPLEAREKTREALTAAGKRFEIVVYPEQDHAFFRHSGGELQETAAASSDAGDAWNRVRAFLRETIG